MARERWADAIHGSLEGGMRGRVRHSLGKALLRSTILILLMSILGILDPTKHQQLAVVWGVLAGAYFLLELVPVERAARSAAQRERDRPRAVQLLAEAVIMSALIVLGFGIIGMMDLSGHGEVAATWAGMAAAWFGLFYLGPPAWALMVRYVRRRTGR